MKKIRIIAASVICAMGLSLGAAGAAQSQTQTVPPVKYWNAAVIEDAKTWCATHKTVLGVPVYSCSKYYLNDYKPSCAWAGVPYPRDVGTCGIKWHMYYVPLEREKTCIGRSIYKKTRNMTSFKVDCYWPSGAPPVNVARSFLRGAIRGAVDGSMKLRASTRSMAANARALTDAKCKQVAGGGCHAVRVGSPSPYYSPGSGFGSGSLRYPSSFGGWANWVSPSTGIYRCTTYVRNLSYASGLVSCR